MASFYMSPGAMKDQFFDSWCTPSQQKFSIHSLTILTASRAAWKKAIRALQDIIPIHYFPNDVLQARLKKLGRERTAASIKNILPTSKKAMSGDLGEILATEYVNRELDFKVPILRLRWKDGRDVPMRGDDILAIKIEQDKRVHFLKGEVKSRERICASTVEEAQDALGKNSGRPSAFVINFVVNRLSEIGETTLAEILEEHLSSKSIPVNRLSHLLFTLSGNDSTEVLWKYLTSCRGKIPQIVVGLVVEDHSKFVKAAFYGVSSD